MSIAWSLFYLMWRWNFSVEFKHSPLNDGYILELRRFTLTKKSTLNMMYSRVAWCLFIYLSVFLSICISICLAIYISIYTSICLSFHLSIFLYFTLSNSLSIYLSSYLSICPYVYLSDYQSIFLSINLYICNVTIYPSVFVYLDNGIIEMLFDHKWSKILLQKALLNQREGICCLNLNWWNNLNLILTLSNFWDALPSLVNTEKFIISYGYRLKNSDFKE